MTELIIAEIVKGLIPIAGVLLTGLTSVALLWLKNFVKAKTQNELVNNALTRVSNTTETVVANISQTVVKGLKDASSDGKLTKEDAIAVKKQAMDAIMLQLPDAVVKNAKLGINFLDGFISTKIEQAVLKQKAMAPGIKGA